MPEKDKKDAGSVFRLGKTAPGLGKEAIKREQGLPRPEKAIPRPVKSAALENNRKTRFSFQKVLFPAFLGISILLVFANAYYALFSPWDYSAYGKAFGIISNFTDMFICMYLASRMLFLRIPFYRVLSLAFLSYLFFLIFLVIGQSSYIFVIYPVFVLVAVALFIFAARYFEINFGQTAVLLALQIVLILAVNLVTYGAYKVLEPVRSMPVVPVQIPEGLAVRVGGREVNVTAALGERQALIESIAGDLGTSGGDAPAAVPGSAAIKSKLKTGTGLCLLLSPEAAAEASGLPIIASGNDNAVSPDACHYFTPDGSDSFDVFSSRESLDELRRRYGPASVKPCDELQAGAFIATTNSETNLYFLLDDRTIQIQFFHSRKASDDILLSLAAAILGQPFRIKEPAVTQESMETASTRE